MRGKDPFDEGAAGGGILRRPKAVRATAGASVVAFMGIGLVDPSSVLVAPRLQRRFGSLKVLGASLVLLAADLLVLGYGSHGTAVVATIVSGAFIGMNNTVFTELALGVSDAPRPVASAGYNFVRWFAAAAAPFLAPKIEEWTDVHVPFVVAALAGAAVVGVRRTALTHEAEELEPVHAREDSVAVFAD